MNTHKKKRVILHIGALKTGSSAIQYFCRLNFERLKNQGIYYPGNKYDYGLMEEIEKGERAANAAFLTTKYYNRDRLNNILSTFESDPDLHTMLLSEECLFLNIFKGTKIHPEAKKALQEFDTHVLVFLRKSTEYFAGTWQESIRSGACKSFSSHIKNYNYEGCLKNLYQLRQDFGHDKLHIELYNDPSVSNYNSIDVILKYLRFKDDDTKSSKARINGAVSRDYLESLSIINATLSCKMPRKYRRFIPVLSDQTAHESLSDIEIQTIVNRCEPIEKQIAKDFLGRENLFENSFPDHYKQLRDEYVYTQKNLKEKMFKPLIKIVFFDVYFKKNKFFGWVVFCSIRMLPIKYGKRLLELLKKSNLIKIS